MVLFCFTLVFMYDISGVYLANIVFYFLFLKSIFMNGIITIKMNNLAKYFLLAFIIWATFSTFIFSFSDATNRSIIQYLFTIQYFVLLISLNLPIDKFELWIYRFSSLLALIIIALYAYFYITSPLAVSDKMWAVNYIPGWPNSVPIPLLVGLWLSFIKKRHFVMKLVFFTALILTASRTGYIGGIIIIGYFLFKKAPNNKSWLLYLILFLGFLTSYIIVLKPSLIDTLLKAFDRIDIFWTTMRFVELRPLIGFGGNTIDQLMSIYGDPIALKNWEQTHNWFLEILLRYGSVGVILFTAYITSIFTKIQNTERKFMFSLLILCALFQIYIRDFIFLCYLMYLSNENFVDSSIEKVDL